MARGNPIRQTVKPGIIERTNADGTKVYEIQYRDTNRKVRKKVVRGGGIRRAEAELGEIRAKKFKGERVVPNPRLTFGQAASEWQASISLKVEAGDMRPATKAIYESCLNNHLLPTWGRRRLDTFVVDDVITLIEEKRGEGKKAETLKSILTPAKQIFDFAGRRMGWSGENPVNLLEKADRPKDDKKASRILSVQERNALLEAAEPHYRLIFDFALSTGARLGETLGLKWSKINLENGSALIDRQIDKQGEYSPVKSGRKGEREIPLPDELVKALRKHKLASRYSAYDDFVFVTKNGTAHNHGNIAQRVLRRTIKKAKIADPAPSMHDFRHTFASAWIAAGVGSVVELSKHLGHADPSITMKRYSHEFEKAERGEALREGLGNLYGPSLAAALATDD